MSTTPAPVQPTPVPGGYQQESNTFSSIDDIFRALNNLTVRISQNSPPVIGNDIQEAQLVIDRTTSKLYMVINGTLKSVTFS